MSKVIFITGASKGLGRALTEEALQQGHQVVASARNSAELQDLVTQYGDAIMTPELDVTQRDQVHRVVEAAIDRYGKIDVLINNAGFGVIGAIEEFSEHEARQQMETNFFGTLWVTQEILPYFRSRHSGHVINISSVAGHVGFSGSSMYAASKHAMEGLSQGLAAEVSEFGVKVSVINPGPFRTEFAGQSLRLTEKKIEDYTGIHQRQLRMKTDMHGHQPGDPEMAAKAILKITEMKQPPFTLPLGEMAYEVIPGRVQEMMSEIRRHADLGLPTDFYPLDLAR